MLVIPTAQVLSIMPLVGETKKLHDVANDDSIVLGVCQLLTKLNPADQSCHILTAHAMFNSGCTKDAEIKLKKMLQEKHQVRSHA